MRRRKSQRITASIILPVIIAAAVLSYFYSRDIYAAYLRFYYEKIRGLSTEDLTAEARSMYQRREYQEILSRLEPILAAYPDSRELRSLYGLSLIRLGHSERGVDEVLTAAEDGKLNGEELKVIVPALFDQKRYRDIIAIFRVNTAAGNPHLLFMQGVALYQTGRTAEAAAVLRRAVEGGKDDYLAYYYLGVSLDRSGRPADAVIPLERARAMNREDSSVVEALASVYRKLGRYDQAARLLRSVTR